jgi:hypothetical protein
MYLLFSGFRGSYRPPAPPTHGLEDNVPDVHDEADLDIPDTQAVLERFMTHMSKLADVEYQVQGQVRQGKLLLSFNKYMLVICILYTMHIPCISKTFNLYTQKISTGYKLYMPSISQVYCVYISITYTMHIPCNGMYIK